MKKNILLFLSSLVLSFILVEGLTRFIIGHPLETTKAGMRIMLFSKGKSFRNVDNFFMHGAHQDIRSDTYFIHDKTPKREFTYTLRTNNLGLVQQADIADSSHVDVILGDSFTEGQGAEPWFYDFEDQARMNGRNFVNGGILGTGPLQWELLLETLKSKHALTFRTVNLVLLGTDITRPVWNFDEPTLRCLETAECPEPTSDFFGYDFAGKTEGRIADDVLEFYRSINDLTLKGLFNDSLTANVKKAVKKSAAAYIGFKTLQTELKRSEKSSINISNLEAIGRMATQGGQPGFILLVTTMPEAGAPDPQWDEPSREFMDYAREKGLTYDVCVLQKQDFHANDGHPNRHGYSKLRECVARAAGLARL